MQDSIVQEFIRKTKLRNMGESGREQGMPLPAFEQNPEGACDTIALPAPDASAFPAMDVLKAIETRMSVREYSSAPMTLGELSMLLWCTQGVKRIIPNIVALRNVPSAGAVNAFETFLLINRVGGLQSGLYKYAALDHALLRLASGEGLSGEYMLACDEQGHVQNSCVTFIWTAVADRMTWSYADRGYRYLFLDAGHVCQNLYLAAEKLNIGVCAIGHFDDDRLNALLGVDGVKQFALYAATAGKKENA